MRVSSSWFVFVLLVFLCGSVRADSSWLCWQVVKQARLDLNSDGKPENIRLQVFKEKSGDRWYPSGVYRLWVNNQSVWGKGAENVRGFGLADLQKADRFKEIMVVSQFQDPYTIDLLRFDGRKLRRVSALNSGFARFYGDGRVDWTISAGSFWEATTLYRLRRGHLQLVPRDLYPIGQNATLAEPVAIHKTRKSKKPFKVLPQGSHVTVVKGTLNGHYVVRSGKYWGWITSKQIQPLRGLKFAG